MQQKTLSLITLSILSVVDAYLLAHPNLIGRFGVAFYDYSYIATFPKALLTVLATVGVAYGISILVKERFSSKSALVILSILLALSILIEISTYLKFSHGTYSMTGSRFKLGANLLPCMLIIIFLQRWYEVFREGFAGKS
jgi:hypothetical protein